MQPSILPCSPWLSSRASCSSGSHLRWLTGDPTAAAAAVEMQVNDAAAILLHPHGMLSNGKLAGDEHKLLMYI